MLRIYAMVVGVFVANMIVAQTIHGLSFAVSLVYGCAAGMFALFFALGLRRLGRAFQD
jgi:hypothetical protein